MEDSFIPTLFVTANVGSIFEDPQNLLKMWIREFLSAVKCVKPKFVALHCQEVGGKNYEESMCHVDDFVRMLMASEELRDYGQVRVYLDEDFTSTERFTALGNLYFVHNGMKNVLIWDYKELKFMNVEGKEVHSGNIERVTTKEKAKFPQELFPECKWSRKGFMRTRWNVCGTVFDLINIHLFHDASNFIAMESFPSVYSKNRQNALAYALRRFATDKYGSVPYFIFGDFNFRVNTNGIIQKLSNSTIPVHIKSTKNGEVEKVQYKDKFNENKVVLTVEKKLFDFIDHDFFCNSGNWLREYDRELEMFKDELFEFDKEFPPSYPFCEDTVSGTAYMKTRCPAWCDRILMNKAARSLVDVTPADSKSLPVRYELVGADVAMGDHKPVMLLFRLQPNTQKGRLTPFLFKSQALDVCVLQSHLPSHRTVSHPPLLLSSDSFVTNGTVSAASYVFGACDTSNDVLPARDEIYLSALWPFTHAYHHSSSSQEWYSHVHDNTTEHIYVNADISSNTTDLQVQIENSDANVISSSIFPQNSKDATEQHLLLHACPTSSTAIKYFPHLDEKKSYKCCPCVLL